MEGPLTYRVEAEIEGGEDLPPALVARLGELGVEVSPLHPGGHFWRLLVRRMEVEAADQAVHELCRRMQAAGIDCRMMQVVALPF